MINNYHQQAIIVIIVMVITSHPAHIAHAHAVWAVPRPRHLHHPRSRSEKHVCSSFAKCIQDYLHSSRIEKHNILPELDCCNAAFLAKDKKSKNPRCFNVPVTKKNFLGHSCFSFTRSLYKFASLNSGKRRKP